MGGRAAHIKLVLPVRQAAADQIQIDPTGVLVIALQRIARLRVAVDHVEVQGRVGLGQRFEHALESVVGTVAHAVEQMHGALGLLAHAPAQHAHHGRDTDAARNQHRRNAGIGVHEKTAGRCLHPEQIAFVHAVVEVAGRRTGRQLGPARGWHRTLDGDAVGGRVGAAGE
jgi:hypothetical protein